MRVVKRARWFAAGQAGPSPGLAAKPIGGSFTFFIEVEGIEDLFKKVRQHGVKITMPIKDQFYGMREFAMEYPDGSVITRRMGNHVRRTYRKIARVKRRPRRVSRPFFQS